VFYTQVKVFAKGLCSVYTFDIECRTYLLQDTV